MIHRHTCQRLTTQWSRRPNHILMAGPVLLSPLPRRTNAVATLEPGQVGRSSLKRWSSGAVGNRRGALLQVHQNQLDAVWINQSLLHVICPKAGVRDCS